MPEQDFDKAMEATRKAILAWDKINEEHPDLSSWYMKAMSGFSMAIRALDQARISKFGSL